MIDIKAEIEDIFTRYPIGREQREAVASLCSRVRAEEREDCANICESMRAPKMPKGIGAADVAYDLAFQHAASAIRHQPDRASKAKEKTNASVL